MAQNYASKFSAKVDERFTLASKTDAAVNKDYDFVGVNAVNVYSLQTTALTDYSMTGDKRYGTPKELDDTKQTLTLMQDKAFTFTIDKRNNADSMNAKEAGRALRREIDEVVIPEIDKYRLGKFVTASENEVTPEAVTKTNAYEKFLDAQNMLLENKVPETNRYAYVSPTFYKCIKQDPAFILASEAGMKMKVTGAVGMVDGVEIIPVPTTYLPETVELIIVHKSACCSPIKLAEYKMHVDPPGINGTLIEGRIYYDAFILNSKKKGIATYKNA